MADTENGEKEDGVGEVQRQESAVDAGDELELQSQISENGSVQDVETSNNPRGVSLHLLCHLPSTVTESQSHFSMNYKTALSLFRFVLLRHHMPVFLVHFCHTDFLVFGNFSDS